MLCPHICMGCGRLGELICGCCKNDIKNDYGRIDAQKLEAMERRFNDELVGQHMLDERSIVWAVGERKGLLDELIKHYKYTPTRGAGGVLAELLAEIIPNLEGEVVVVPLPTIRKHVRERGFDHTVVMARKLARLRGWRCEKLLERQNKTVQVGANAEQREQQAKRAYYLRKMPHKEVNYILIDDVWTTGASMCAARRMLCEGGAKRVCGAVVAVSGEASVGTI